MQVICKKCFLGVQAENYTQMIEKCMSMISPRDRTPEAQFAQRIAVCEECKDFVTATCQVCGCYVEIRAAKKNVHCPCKKW